MPGLQTDVRHAVRGFRSRPVFALGVLMTLALGIGASTAMFSVLNAVLLQPLPQQNADRVVRLYQPNDISETTGLSPLEIADVRAQAQHVLDDVVEYHSMPFTFLGAGEPQRLQTGVVSARYFEVLGIEPWIGRTFRAGEDEAGAEPVLVLSHGYWQREFGGDPNVLGRTLRMNDRTHTVVGVLPPFPQYPDENDVYMPMSSCPFRSAPGWAENRAARGLAVFGLLAEDVTAGQAARDVRTVTARLRAEYPDAYRPDTRYDVAAVPLDELIAQPARATVVMLLIATLLLLAIVCSNVGSLMIVRQLQRGGEIAVRQAFGASRGRIARQLLAESGLLALAGAALGILVAMASTQSLAAILSRFTPRAVEIGVSPPVLFFALAAAVATALTAGLLPLVTLRRNLSTTLRGSAERTGTGVGHARVRDLLIIVQVAISLTLLAGAGLLLRSLLELQRVDTGFNAAQVMTARLDLNWTRYDTQERRYALYSGFENALATTPGVQAAGIGSSFPLNDDPANAVQFVADDAQREVDRAPDVAAMTASPGYFAALGVPMLQGRAFTVADENPDGEAAGIVTRSLAERYWPGGGGVGQRISLDGGQNWARVVGIIGDLRLGLEGDYDDVVFVPHNRFAGIQSRVLVRTNLQPAAAERALRRTLARIDPDQPLTDIRSLAAHRSDRLAPYRVTTALMTLFALIALGVTALGLGGAAAFSVAQRTREIGIRAALGAPTSGILGLVLGGILACTAAGTAIGLVLTWHASRLVGSRVPGIHTLDVRTMVGVISLLAAVTALAALAPARRALRVDPLRAMRDD